jgi:thiamine biosynthesis lipoprotein
MAPGTGGVEVDDVAGTARVPAGVSFDPGGIGKGLAADLAVVAVAAAGASGALVSVGGDVRVWGRPPQGQGWTLTVQDPFTPDRDAAAVVLRDGGVATSSVLGRRWHHAGSPMHHVVDPATGSPVDNGVVAVTAVAGTAWWAEVLTKAVLVTAGCTDAIGDDAAVLWRADGSRRHIGRAAAFFTAAPVPDPREVYA